jgi:hypothetical protein
LTKPAIHIYMFIYALHYTHYGIFYTDFFHCICSQQYHDIETLRSVCIARKQGFICTRKTATTRTHA